MNERTAAPIRTPAVEETLFYSVEFGPGPVMRKTIIDFDVKYGPAFVGAFK